MAGSGTGIFALGGTLLVLDFFVIFGWKGGGASGLHTAIAWALLLAGLFLGGLGIWRVLHSQIPFRPRPGAGPAASSRSG